MKIEEYVSKDIAWCPGCGNFGIRVALMKVFEEMKLDPRNVVIVSGIGQAAKMPHYIGVNMFNGLHGRALPAATAIKVANPNLLVIAESGDGCMYGEGGNHFIHTIRRNPDIVNIVHNNMVYGLTKGQASPTSLLGFKTPVQVDGTILEPFNPLAVAIALDASFVARTFIGDIEFTKDILKEAIKHKGYALVDILQPCVTFNRVNTYEWYKENTYYLKNHDPKDRELAFKRAIEKEKLPLGIFYVNSSKKTFDELVRRGQKTPLFEYEVDIEKLNKLIESKKM
ncbi:MAG: thiamine pyrophosphate-dependent enzyme [Synergistetes bacterium]|nr:thiamine pyrophosphate-dependent enzyme [Synergistota bacterium]MDW8193166.1 thiamine pyrophosphate-dependent enzyme [Synergistota bacterium]